MPYNHETYLKRWGDSPRPCKVCQHPFRDEIEARVTSHIPYSEICRDFKGFSERTLKNHCTGGHMLMNKSKMDEIIGEIVESPTMPHTELRTLTGTEIRQIGYNKTLNTIARLEDMNERYDSSRVAQCLIMALKVLLDYADSVDRATVEEVKTPVVTINVGRVPRPTKVPEES